MWRNTQKLFQTAAATEEQALDLLVRGKVLRMEVQW